MSLPEFLEPMRSTIMDPNPEEGAPTQPSPPLATSSILPEQQWYRQQILEALRPPEDCIDNTIDAVFWVQIGCLYTLLCCWPVG